MHTSAAAKFHTSWGIFAILKMCVSQQPEQVCGPAAGENKGAELVKRRGHGCKVGKGSLIVFEMECCLAHGQGMADMPEGAVASA